MTRALSLLEDIRGCRLCEKDLPLGPRPVLSFAAEATIMLVGQAPGTKVHNTGIPWNDPSGERLRSWLGLDAKEFYDPKKIAIVPMGFCYPGRGKSGDLPPRKECATTWMAKIVAELSSRQLTILIGQYAINYFLREKRKKTLTATVESWQEYLPDYLVLPHPSPRNNIWLKKNPWFEKTVLPEVKSRLHQCFEQ